MATSPTTLAEPGFEGLQEVSAPAAPSAAAEPGFEGLEEVNLDAGFEGLQEADRLDLDEEGTLASDDEFRPAQFIAENPNVAQEPERFQKLLNVYRQKRIKGLEFGKVAKAAVKEAPGIVAKVAKGAGQLASRVVDIGVSPAVNEVLGFVTGTDMTPLREETRRRQLKGAAEISAGTEQAVTGLTQLAQQGGRKLFGTDPQKATDSELYDQLLVDSEFHKLTQGIAQGQSELSQSLGLDAEFLSKNGVQLDPKAIENLSLVDPLTLVATGGVFKVVGVGGKILATAATRAGAQSVINGLKTAGGKALQVAGKGAQAAGQAAQKLPLRTPGMVATGGTLATGNIPGAVAAAVTPAAVRAGGRALERAGQVVSEVGQAVTPGFIGPPTASASRILQMAASPAARAAKTVAGGAAVGTALAAPLALAADDSQTAGAILGGGGALGAVAGAALSGGRGIANVVAKKYLDPHSIPLQPVESRGYGVDANLDKAHETAISTLPAPEQNAINNFREALRQQGGEIYAQDGAAYLERIRETLRQEDGVAQLSPEREALAQTYADTHAFFDGNITDAAGNTRRVVFLNSSAKGLPHDAGHLFQALLSPERQAQLRQAVLEGYTPEQLREFAQDYQRRLGDPEYFNKLGEEAGLNKVADEIIAENFSQIFGNSELSNLKAPPKLLETLGRTAAEAAETLGFDLTAGRTTPDLGVKPTFGVQNLLRNAAREVLNLPPEKPQLTLTKATLPEKVPTAADIVPPVSPDAPVSPGGEIPKVGETPAPKEPVIDAAAKRSQETGIAEAREMVKDSPEVAATVDTISKSMEAGNPALKIEHRGITSTEPVGPRGEARSPRRGTQAKGYEELERLQIENRANAPEEIVSVHEKTFVPVRWVSQGGKATLIAMSVDKVIGNVRKIVTEAAANKAESLIPYESVGGELTPEAWNQAIADIKTYAENQSNGYRGDGSRLVRPSDEAGVSIPAENPNYTPKKLGEAQANFANLVQGIAPPETARQVKGQVPGNIKAQLVAEANLRTPQPVAKVSAKDIQKQSFGKPFEGRTIKETNPLRNELASRGVNVRSLTEVTERFAAQDIASVGEAAPGAQMKAPVTDTIRGGFLPKDRPVSEVVSTVESATPEDLKTMFGPQQSLTKSAFETGLNLKSMEEVTALKEAQTRANDLGKAAMERFKGGDAEALLEVQAQGLKAQFFREAHEAATDTGSASNPRVGWRRMFPEGKPPFAAAKPESPSFLPARREGAPETNVFDVVSKLPPVAPGKVRLFHGEGGAQGGGTGGAFYASDPMKASTFGSNLTWVDLPIEKAKAAWERAKQTGFPGGDNFLLDAEDLKASQRLQQRVTQPIYDLDARFLPKPDKAIRDLASEYAKTAKVPYRPADAYAEVNPTLAAKLADFYESAKSSPEDPAVQKSYQALADETIAQYKAITDAGYTIEPFKGEGEPYKNSDEAIKDIRENKHLYFLKTEGNFAGAGDNPMLADSGIVIADEPLLVNDVFRAVHDFFGHGKEGYQFGPRGEFNAWRAHSEMYSPEAQGALAAETLAQNSWVNFGKHLRKNGKVPQKGEEGFVPMTERPFAEQKAIVIPGELIQEAKGGLSFLPSDDPRAVSRAAVQDSDGRIYSGSYHGAAIDNAQRMRAAPIEGYSDPSWDVPFKVGFVTNEGKFLTREEAFVRGKELNQLPADLEPVEDVVHTRQFKDAGAFLPRARKGAKVEAADIKKVKRDEQGRPLTRGGLVDYDLLAKERTAERKAQEEADMAELDVTKYETPEGATVTQASTGWVLPDGNFVPIDAAYHQDWLAKNSAQLNEDFGTKFSDTASVEERLSALNAGFVRVRDNRGANTVIELNARFWKGDTKKKVEDLLLNQPNDVFPDRFTVTLLDNDGNTVDSTSARLFDSENPRQDATEALGQLKAVTTERRKVGPTDIQRARAMGQSREPQFLPRDEVRDVAEDFIDRYDREGAALLSQFENSKPGDQVSWPRIPAPRLKRIWLDFGKSGVVRDEKGLLNIEDQMLNGVARLRASTELLGHTSNVPKESAERFGFDLTPEKEEALGDFLTDKKGQWMLSDFGLPKLEKLAEQLYRAESAEDKLYVIDRMLNVIHQRSDLADFFVEGGSATLREIADQGGYVAPESGPQFLPKGGTKEFNDYVTERIKESKQHPEALPLDFRKDDKGNYVAGFNGEPLMVAVDYAIRETPLGKKAKTDEKLASELAKGLVREYETAKKNPEVAAGETWYSLCREKLSNLLGDDTKLFAELLGATSPQTNVDTNFGYALDAYNQFKTGAYDKILEKYREGKDEFAAGNIEEFSKETGKTGKKATREAFLNWWVDKHDLIPKSPKGKRFGMNSKAVLRVLDGSWASQVKGPKTPNFTGNLSGQTFEATIDVWAMRLLHRLANEGNTKRWRIQPGNETGVTDKDFFLGQKAFREAAEKVGIKPDALQAILWFAEKEYWTKKGWTKSVGSKKSDFNVLLDTTERTPEGTLRRTDKVDNQLQLSDIVEKKP